MEQSIHGYEIKDTLNNGAFCNVYLANKNGILYILKYFKDPTYKSPDFNDFVENQKIMQILLESLGDMVENIIEQFVDKGFFYQIKQYIEGQNLREWMETNDDYYHRLDLAIQIGECIKAVHKKGIVFQDFKPENVMLVKNLSKKAEVRPVLIDFDWSLPNGRVVRYVGTPGYTNIDGEKLSNKSDIFMFGIVLCELLTGANPYIYTETDEIRAYEPTLWMEWVEQKNYIVPIKINDELPETINDVIVKCLEPNPDNRPTIDEILKVLKDES